MNTPTKAVLILGPTGTGKTPLGQHLEEMGLSGRACVHFDFGEALRHAGQAGVLSDRETSVVNRVLAETTLLEDSEFSIAGKLLVAALDKCGSAGGGLVVLNGLPRHAGQAEMIADWVQVDLVVQLACTPEVVHARIQSNAGGDRAGRVDDSSGEMRKKLEIYEARTAPLVEHYRERGAVIRRIEVGVETQPGDIVNALERDAAENGQKED